METLIVAAASFVGTHFLLSHPLRAPIVKAIGNGGFMLVYTVVAFATLGWMAETYRKLPAQTPLWDVGDTLWAVGTAVMLLASILFVGSLIRNPAMPGMVSGDRPPAPRGVFAITRHPMMWGFALWALVHIAVFPDPANLVLAGAILILALVGSALQDAKKAKLQPEFWPRWQAVTSHVPFGALTSGRAQWAAAWPGTVPTIGGTILWLAASWAHIPLANMPAGIWKWMG